MSPCRAAILVAACLLSRVNADDKGIASVETYGLHHVERKRVLDVAGLSEGDRPPRSIQWKAITGRLEKIPDVKRAAIVVVTVPFEDDKGVTVGRPVVYLGIQETDQPGVQFRPAPTGKVTLPKEIIALHAEFEKAFLDAVRHNNFNEDDSNGYALMDYPAARAIQRKFPALADQHYELLLDVLQNSKYADQRAIAAMFLGYATNKQRAATDLVIGTRDSSERVRNDAVRALSILMKYARAHRDAGINVSTDWCLELLESVTWTDRNKAMATLDAATVDRDPALLASLRQRSLPALAEMSHWKFSGHAMQAFLLVGRLAGLSDAEITQAWKAGERDKVIEKARGAAPREPAARASESDK
jgi:hypothetical protein